MVDGSKPVINLQKVDTRLVIVMSKLNSSDHSAVNLCKHANQVFLLPNFFSFSGNLNFHLQFKKKQQKNSLCGEWKKSTFLICFLSLPGYKHCILFIWVLNLFILYTNLYWVFFYLKKWVSFTFSIAFIIYE